MAQRLSQLASELWPFLLPKVGAMVQGAGGGGVVSGGGTVGLHDLSGSLHKGTLADAQAPQFLLRNGTRSLSGSLAVDAGITIDGVDISAHAADINAHHAKLHAITDAANHSVTGSQYQIVGLTAVNTLGLLTPSATPAANAVVKTDGSSAVTLVDLTVTSDLFMAGYLDFGTDVMYEDASYLQVTGSKAVRFGQNIGNANWTVYNTGGAAFGGSVDITNGGDLTVAGSGSYAGNQVLFADSSGGNVGIMMAPDPQFALDINGPARATYWIGPHALQLKNVLLLSHFDGRAPYETNYSGEVNGHMGQVGTVSGGAIFRPGKFYKAIQVAEATTNLITNPSFETGVTGWAGYNSGTVAQSALKSLYGSYSMLVTVAATGQGCSASASGLTASAAHTLSAWVYLTVARTVTIHASDNIDKDLGTTAVAVPANEWTRVSHTFTTDTHTTAYFQIYANGATSIFVDAVQLEAKAYTTPYCDGSLGGYDANGVPDGSAHAWTVPASPHASTSTRSAAVLSYSTNGNINAGQWTVAAWVNPASITAAAQTLLRMSGTTAGHVIIELDTAGKPRSYSGTTAVTADNAISVGVWSHLAVTYDGGTLRIYVNGAEVKNGASSGFVGTPATMYVGCYSTQTKWNGLIDDFVILDRAMPAAEIRSVYESNAPVFAETSTFTFRPTPKGLIWADDEGLWMRDSSGKPVLGIYGGETYKSSWGGFNLYPGDLLIGNNAVGSSAIFWDQSAGTFGFYGAGSGTPQVEIATDGRLTAGAGKVALDSTGFKAYNAALVETININATGIYMGDGGARTTIASWTSGGRIQFYSVGEAYEATPETYLDDSSISRTLYPLVIRGVRQGNDAALIELAAVRSDTGAGAKIIIGEGFRLKGYFSGSGNSYATNRVVHALADDVILESTNLQLLGQTTSTGAVGTYAGKIKVRIAGTDRYIPFYAS